MSLDTLKSLLRMSDAELRSRSNAIPELRIAIGALLPALEGVVSEERVTSPEVAKIAGEYMGMEQFQFDALINADRKLMFQDIKSMAASLVSQAPGPDANQASLPLAEEGAKRAIDDAVRTGQADPKTRTVALGPDTTGEAEPLPPKE